ncbi:MAG: outer membrane protein assembly factor BamA [bacterium]
MRKPIKLLLPLAVALACQQIQAREIPVSDIQVQGLERISKGTVYTYLPIDVGERFDTRSSARLIRSLYESGLFDDIQIGVDGNTLVVKVKERPSIHEVSFEGNKDIPDDKLEEALKKAKLSRGRVYNRSVLEKIKQELRQQYLARGKYNVKIDAQVEQLDNNQVDVNINISEGVASKIRRVNIVGNKRFNEKKLTKDFNSGVPSWWAFLSTKDEYARPKLQGDLETLKSFYLDKGYLNFNVDSTNVTITPDKKDMYITINVDEGEIYNVSDVKLRGDLIVSEEELKKLIEIEPGDVFSRATLTRTTSLLEDKLGGEGYAFARVSVIPDIDQKAKTVGLTFVVEPGQRVYVRRINIHGNYKTRDEVFRREMRQLEGAWYSTPEVKRSRVRLQRLSFIESVNIEKNRVPGRSDLVDLDITVAERLSGSFSAGAGYSQNQGVLFNLGLKQDNAFGTGNRLNVEFNNSAVSTVYSVGYTNPYYTVDGVSRGFSAFYRTVDSAENSVASYLSDRYGVSMNYGIPLTEYDRLGFSIGAQRNKIKTTGSTPTEITDFLADNGDDYSLYILNATYTHDTRDRTVFATEGNLQRLRFEAAIPGSDLDYFKASYRNQWLTKLSDDYTFSLKGDLSYGEGTNGTTDLPFFEKYYAGGINSVRGYEANSLGPLASTDRPFGGNARVLGSAEVFFRAPFAKENPSVRMGVFVDAGNVFTTAEDFDETELRLSSGLSFEWLSPVGPLVFSLAKAIDPQEEDKTQTFQFSLGGSF